MISDVEDASVLPSEQQLRVLATQLPQLDAAKFDEAHRLGGIPWVAAIQEALTAGGAQGVDEIAERIANAVAGCASDVVRWRLVRQLSRLESAGYFTRLASGAWSLAANPRNGKVGDSVRDAVPGRWAHHQITDRYDPEHDALFHIESIPGANEIVLNQSHPYYESLRDLLLSEEVAGLEPEEMRRRLQAAAQIIRGLLVAWAEYEDGEKAGPRREHVREARQAWGRAAKRVAHSEQSAARIVST